jgi:hypothetical protein
MPIPKPLLAALVLAAAPALARAHCDTLDGPVVKTARAALETSRIAPVLAWVRPQDEAEVKAAFQHALEVRKLGPAARELADTWFFETVVRVHRAGEGAPYTGLKPAGSDLDPAVAAADRSIETGSDAAVEKLLLDAVRRGLHERFALLKSRKAPGDDVAAGRAWVAAYVPYVHYAEGVHAAAKAGSGAHGGPDGEGHGHARAEPEPHGAKQHAPAAHAH